MSPTRSSTPPDTRLAMVNYHTLQHCSWMMSCTFRHCHDDDASLQLKLTDRGTSGEYLTHTSIFISSMVSKGKAKTTRDYFDATASNWNTSAQSTLARSFV